MKILKIIGSIILGLSFPLFASAQLSVVQGGTGTSSVPANWFLVGSSQLHLTATGTPFFYNLSFGNATGSAATTTSFYNSGVTTLGGSLLFNSVASRITPGATSFNITNNAGTRNNFSISDAGILTTSQSSSADNFVLTYTGATGELPAGSLLRNNIAGGNLILLSNTQGTTGKILSGYYNGTSYLSAWEISHIASGFGNLLLLKAGGHVGIGSSTPYSILDIVNNVSTVINTPLFSVASTTAGTATTTLFTILPSGKTGIGNSNPSQTLDITGTLNVSLGATTTDLDISHVASSTALYSNSANVGSLTANSLTYNNLTGNNATSTSLYNSGLASTTLLRANTSIFGDITVDKCTGCGGSSITGATIILTDATSSNISYSTTTAVTSGQRLMVWAKCGISNTTVQLFVKPTGSATSAPISTSNQTGVGDEVLDANLFGTYVAGSTANHEIYIGKGDGTKNYFTTCATTGTGKPVNNSTLEIMYQILSQ